MPPVTGNYSRTIRGSFNEQLRFAMGFVRKGIPWVDADENAKEWIRFTLLRRAFQILIGNASPDNGYRIVGSGLANDFSITGGDGTLNGAGRMYVGGMGCFLLSNVLYTNAGATRDQRSIFPRITAITGLGDNELNDSSANYTPGELVGRTITPDVTQPATTMTITANTANVLTLSGDLAAAGVVAGARYRIEITTPVGNRTDGIYLDAYIDEADGTDEPDIKHDLGPLMTAQHFGQIQQRILVKEGDTNGLPGSVVLNYIDLDGFEHFLVKIADVARFTGQAAINLGDVTDRRETSGSLTAFVRKIGDNMTGDLNMQAGANIVMAALGLVDGRDVSVDGAKLDTIIWTPQGIADQLKKSSAYVAGTPLVGVSAAVTNVSTHLKDKTPAATETVKGVFTTAPNNYGPIRQTTTNDVFLAGADGKQGVFSRLTHEPTVAILSGTWTWTNAGFSVTSGAGLALTELQIGDIVQGPDGEWYTVDTVPGNNQFTIVEPFGGVTAPQLNPPTQRWLLTLRVNDAGVEGNFVPGAPINVTWYYHACFDEADRPVIDTLGVVLTDQVAANVPYATTAISGVVTLAVNGGVVAGTVVQATDTRLGAIKGKSGVTVGGLKPQVELEAGSGVSIVMDDTNPSVVKFTITNSNPGGGGPSAYSGAMSPDSGAGSAGGGGYAQGTHVHPVSSEYRIRVAKNGFSSGATDLAVVTGFTPRLAIFLGHFGDAFCVGVAMGTAAGDQAFVQSPAAGADGGSGLIGATVARASTWAVTVFSNASVTATRSGSQTAGANGIGGFVIGDIF